ncbi:MAG: mechanosensitive ion channel [Rikenellaceae bacterium]
MPIEKIIPTDSTTIGATLEAHEKITNFVDLLSEMSTEEIITMALSSIAGIAFKVLLAFLIYFLGKWLIGRVEKFLQHIFEARQIEISLGKFIISLVKITLTIILILTTVGVLGINTTSFLAIFASAGLAVGMALSGTLQNFAGGVMILFLKPYKIGDFIEAQGYTGTVKEISLFSTLINTVDNKMVIIPNGGLSTGIINNFSKESTRRVDWVFGVAYGTEYEVAKKILLDVVNADEFVLKDIDVFIALDSLGDSSVNIVVRAWTKSENYWPLYFGINEKVYKALNDANISIPFPQMDIHLHNVNN